MITVTKPPQPLPGMTVFCVLSFAMLEHCFEFFFSSRVAASYQLRDEIIPKRERESKNQPFRRSPRSLNKDAPVSRAAALHGSSHYDLPGILRWFTANIGVHHIHHLCSRIPCYRLPDVLRDHPQIGRAHV